MAIKVGGTEVVSNARELKNIATVDSTTVSTLNTALNVDPTKGTLTKTFTQNETAEITLSSNVSVGPVVSATKEVPQTGVSTKGNWDVNSSASNYDFHNTAANVTLTPSTVGYDLSALSYDNKSFNHASAPNLNDIAISSDGTKLYYVGNSNYIWQIPLSTAYDVSTGGTPVYYNQSGYDNDPMDVTFKPDGTKMYVTGDQGNWIYQFNLSTAWDITTAGDSGKNFITTNQTSSPRGTQFKSDGTKMYVMSTTNIYEYSLSTAWDVSTASYTTNNISIGTQDGNQMGMFLKPDGTKMFVVGQNNDKVYQYNFGTAWDLSTASYSNTTTAAFTSTLGTPRGITFSADGAKLYIADFNTAYVHQFTTGTDALVLGSGSFASTDVGKRITGNGGDVILTSTGGAFSTTGGSAFTDSSTIAAGSWSMFGLKSAGDADGITMPKSGADSSTIFDVFGDSSAVSLHQLNNNFTDTGGNYTGTGNSAFNTSAKFGSHSYYTGTNSSDVLTIPYNQPFGAAWTASFWYKRADSGGNLALNSRMVDFKEQSSTGTSITYEDDNQWWFHLQSTSGGVGGKLIGGSSINDNQWHHIVVGSYYDSAATVYKGKVYVDGVESTTTNTNYTRSASNPNTGIVFGGVYSYTNEQYFDQIRIFNKTLTQTEVDVLYTELGSALVATGSYHVGVTNSGGQIDSQYFTDINSMTAAQSATTGTVHYAVSTDGRTTWSVNKGTDGIRPIVRNNSGTWQYNNDAGSSTSNDLSVAAYNNNFIDVSANLGSGNLTGCFWSNNGSQVFLQRGTNLANYNLSTPYDLTTASYVSYSSALGSQDGVPFDIWMNSLGTRLYMCGGANDTIYQYNVTTANNLNTLSYTGNSINVNAQETENRGIWFGVEDSSNAPTKMWVVGFSTDTVYEYTFTSSGNLSTASYSGNSFSFASQQAKVNGITFSNDGTKMFICGETPRGIHQYNLSTAWDVTTASYSNVFYSITSILGYGEAFSLCLSTNGEHLMFSDYGGSSPKFHSISVGGAGYATTATWANGTVNDELYTLQQALTAQAFNRMDKTQLDAVADANHFSTGSSLDLMIALRMDTAASTLPTSDGVTLNYDAAALNEGAVLGTDYDFFHPAANKVQIKSLAAQNLKVRVV